jgi:hypothetical protein
MKRTWQAEKAISPLFSCQQPALSTLHRPTPVAAEQKTNKTPIEFDVQTHEQLSAKNSRPELLTCTTSSQQKIQNLIKNIRTDGNRV